MTHKTAGPDSNALYVRSSRPGRPPKRASVGLSLAASHLSHQLKKHRLENGGSDYGDYPNGHLQNDVPRLEKSPLLANGYHHPPTQLSQLQFLQQMNQSAQSGGTPPGVLPPHSGLSRHDAAALMKHHGNLPNIEALARLREERGEAERALTLDQKARDLSSHNGSSNGHSPVLNLSKGGGDHSGSEAGHTGPEDEGDEEENVTDVDDEMEEKHHPEVQDSGTYERKRQSNEEEFKKTLTLSACTTNPHTHALNYSALAGSISPTSVLPNVDPSSVSSTETLLRNIQGLLKVAADNARQQERQINYEKAQLKMDLLREREIKDNLERQLTEERGKYLICNPITFLPSTIYVLHPLAIKTYPFFLFHLITAQLKMDLLREREVKDNLERQLTEER
ncbi:dachshund homolog 2-like, partial [Diaphorina citri]|uniref:Dachshund homolog 2-like n=1 Tax=Diaphorina citri TaxID=121845 RepID=A0A3Q0IXG3_DIACI